MIKEIKWRLKWDYGNERQTENTTRSNGNRGHGRVIITPIAWLYPNEPFPWWKLMIHMGCHALNYLPSSSSCPRCLVRFWEPKLAIFRAGLLLSTITLGINRSDRAKKWLLSVAGWPTREYCTLHRACNAYPKEPIMNIHRYACIGGNVSTQTDGFLKEILLT